MIGLPGNPVSAMVCGHVFLAPMVRAMLGLGAAPAPRTPRAAWIWTRTARGKHYMRARLGDGLITPADRQDSSLLSVLSKADALLVRPAGDGPRSAGEMWNTCASTPDHRPA